MPVARVRAWHVYDKDGEANLLIFADSAKRARAMAWSHGTWEFESYLDLRARRASEWDGLFTAERVIDENDELPPGSKPFYSDPEFAI
jgi:hypothetical protein